MSTIAEIRARRELLLAEAARQRQTLTISYAALAGPATVVGAGLNVVAWLRQHPLVVGAAAALAVILRPRRALKFAGRSLALWRTVRTVSSFLQQARVKL